MLVILAALVLAILIVLYFGLWRSAPESAVSVEPSVLGVEDILVGLAEKIDFDANFLKSSYFKDLKVYGEWPLEIDDKGRTNPFLPY